MTACGPLDRGDDVWATVRALYGALGKGPRWAWERVSREPRAFRRWMAAHRDEVTALRFGNHRKYETHDPDKKDSTADVIESYVRWVRAKGHGSQDAIFSEAIRGQ